MCVERFITGRHLGKGESQCALRDILPGRDSYFDTSRQNLFNFAE